MFVCCLDHLRSWECKAARHCHLHVLLTKVGQSQLAAFSLVKGDPLL